MTHWFEKLAVAAQVRAIAGELRNQERARFYTSVYSEQDESERKRALDQWDQDHPLDRYIVSAIVELDHIAMTIDRYNEPPEDEHGS